MTDEQLRMANNIKSKLKDVEAKIEIIADIQEGHRSVKLYNSEIGSVLLDPMVADEVCGIVMNNLVAAAEALKQEFEGL